MKYWLLSDFPLNEFRVTELDEVICLNLNFVDHELFSFFSLLSELCEH